MGDNTVVKKFMDKVRDLGVDPRTADTVDKDSERKRVKVEFSRLVALRDSSPELETLDLRAIIPLIKKGYKITDVYKGGDLFTIEYLRTDGTQGEMFQEEGARGGEIFIKSASRHEEAATVRVKTVGSRRRFVEEGLSYRKTYTRSGELDTHEEGGALHKFESGQRVFSEDLGTGNRSYYYDGTDRVAFVENPAGQIVKVYDYDANKKFQVDLQPTKYRLAQDQKKLIAKPKLRLRRRLKAYRKKIRARVREADVSGEFRDAPEVSRQPKTGRVVVVAGVGLIAKTQPLESSTGIFGLSEGLVAAFLRSGSAFGSPTVTSSKSSVTAGATESARISDDAAAVRAGMLVPVIIFSEGAVLAMVSHSNSSDTFHDEPAALSDGRDSANTSKKIKGTILRASYKETAGVGAPIVLSERGVVPTSFGERYIAPKRSVRVLDLRISNGTGRQSSLFKGTVLSAASGNQYVIPAALPVLMKAAAPVEAKLSVKDAMRKMLVEKPGRGQRDTSQGNSGNSHGGGEGKSKKDGKPEQPKQADS